MGHMCHLIVSFLRVWNHGKWGSRNWCFVLARPFSYAALPTPNFTGRDLENVATSYKNHYYIFSMFQQ